MSARWPRVFAWLLAAAGIVGPAAAEGIVLSSTAPGMTVGRVIGDDETVRLPEDTLTAVLLPTGKILKLNGPFEGKALADAGRSEAPQGGPMGGWQGMDLTSLGATRGDLLGAVDVPGDDGALTLDPGTAGTWCVGPRTALRLARPAEVAQSSLLLEDTATGARATVAWPDGAAQPWPATLPVRDGTTLLARWTEQGPAHPIRFRMLEAGDKEHAVATVMRWALAGCYRQAAPHLRSLGTQLAPFDLYLSTDRGRTPRYAIGEPITLIMQTNRAARLYCFVIQHGSMAPLFPSPPGHLAIADHTELRIPGERVAVEVAASPPPGVGEVRCYALDLAAGKDPPTIPEDVIADGSGRRLDALFAERPEDQVARAHLFLRID